MTPIDYAAFRGCETRANVPYVYEWCGAVDLDHDGDVDLSDFGLLQSKPRITHAEIIWCWRVESMEPLIQIRPEEILRAMTRPAK